MLCIREVFCQLLESIRISMQHFKSLNKLPNSRKLNTDDPLNGKIAGKRFFGQNLWALLSANMDEVHKILLFTISIIRLDLALNKDQTKPFRQIFILFHWTNYNQSNINCTHFQIFKKKFHGCVIRVRTIFWNIKNSSSLFPLFCRK